jgi:hypothetical protein
MYYKIATSSDTASSTYTFNFPSTTAQGSIACIAGADTVNPINASSSSTDSGITSLDAGTITPILANTFLYFFNTTITSVAQTFTYSTSNTSPTYATQYSRNDVNNIRTGIATAQYAPASATGANTVSQNNSSSMRAAIVAIAPPQPIVVSTAIMTSVAVPLASLLKTFILGTASMLITAITAAVTNSDAKWKRDQRHTDTFTTTTKSAAPTYTTTSKGTTTWTKPTKS